MDGLTYKNVHESGLEDNLYVSDPASVSSIVGYDEVSDPMSTSGDVDSMVHCKLLKLTFISNLQYGVFCHQNDFGIDSGIYEVYWSDAYSKFVFISVHGSGPLHFGDHCFVERRNCMVLFSDDDLAHADQTRREYYAEPPDKKCKPGILKDTEFYLNIIDMLTNQACHPPTSKETFCSDQQGVPWEAVFKGTGDPNNFLPACLSDAPQKERVSFSPETAVNVGFLCSDTISFNFIGPDREPIRYNNIGDYVKVAEIIRSTNAPNYKVARFPIIIMSDLDIDAWKGILQNYDNPKLIQYLTFGFPLYIDDGDQLANKAVCNHFSARHHESQVKQYLDTELKHNAILGPSDTVPSVFYHASPLLTRPKPPDKRRVILDLSFPKGDSVNSHIDKNFFDGHEFVLKLPTLDHIINALTAFRSPLLAKIDISRAFRNIRVDPADALKLGIIWQNKYYLDISAAFGWLHGTTAFEMCTSDISAYFRQKNITMYPYIDDCLFVLESDPALDQFRFAKDVICKLGLPINGDKLTPPSTKITCLGIVVDILANTLSIDLEKINDIKAHCLNTASKKFLSRRAFQSLLGKLFYIHKCIPPARTFMNRMLALFRKNSHKKRIKLSNEFFADLDWLIFFLHVFNGVAILKKFELTSNDEIFLDASLDGIGAVWGERCYAAPFPKLYRVSHHIAHMEMINIVIALRVWGKFWGTHKVRIRCDNLAVVLVTNTGKTRDSYMAACVRNIWWLCAIKDIELEVVHIEGLKNEVADTLSRVFSRNPGNQAILEDLRATKIWDPIDPSKFDLSLGI